MNYSQTEPFFKADIEKIEDQKYEKLTIEDEALIRNVKGQLEKVVSLGKIDTSRHHGYCRKYRRPREACRPFASNIGLKTEQSQEILEISGPGPEIEAGERDIGKGDRAPDGPAEDSV